MLKATIDIGSNSILLLVWDIDKKKEIVSLARIAELGRGLVESAFFSEHSMHEAYQILTEYKKILDEYDVAIDSVVVTATEASRVAKNAESFFKRVKDELGFSVSIISAEGEAYYTARGVASFLDSGIKGDITIMDIGGASTELIRISTNPFSLLDSVSIPCGAVIGAEWRNRGIFLEKMQKLTMGVNFPAYTTRELVSVAGTMTSLASMIKDIRNYDDKAVNGEQFNFNGVRSFIKSVDGYSAAELQQRYPILGKRAFNIQAGMMIADFLGEKLKIDSYVISTFGLRYGVLLTGEIYDRYSIHQ